jgi:phospholipase/carboxylesterase
LELPLEYNFLAPKQSSKETPLLIMLHGYGSDENDLFSFADQLNEKFMVISLKAPLPLPWGGNAWYEITYSENAEKWTNIPQAIESRKLIIECLEKIKEAFSIGDVYLLGFSQGAILSYSLSINYPELFSGVLALSGYIEPKLIPDKIEDQEYPEIFASHGVQDPVIPVQWARQSQQILTKNNISVSYNEYEMAHGINPQCFNDMLEWLKTQNLL